MSFPEPSAGVGHNFADLPGSFVTFTVTPSVDSGKIKFTLSDPKGIVTSFKMLRAIIGDAIDQWIATNAVQLATNSVVIGYSSPATFGGSDPNRPPGDGYYKIDWNKSGKYAHTPAITTTSLTTDAITVSKPYADVV